MGWPAL